MIVEEWKEMEVEEEEGEEAVCVTLSWKSKLDMNEVALFEYFNTRLEETTQCAPIKGAHALQSWVMQVHVLPS
jgi:hypothetical protein